MNEPPSEPEDTDISKLQDQLKIEKISKKAEIEKIQNELEAELRETEQKWMEKVRKVAEERDIVIRKMDEFEEKIENMKRQVHRSETYKLELDEANKRLKMQYETLYNDYQETMQERSVVLEENSRLIEEKERLYKQLEHLKLGENEELLGLRKKLEHTKKLLQVNMEETVSANAKKEAALAKCREVENFGTKLLEERDEALRKAQQYCGDSVVDIWNTHKVQVDLPFPKPNLGIVLGGGRTDDSTTVHGPIYVKYIGHGSPFENVLKKLDHIVMVNDISVIEMDERSVISMLSNCHHIHLVIRRRANCNRIVDITLPLSYDVGLELANGVFINSVEPNGTASRSGLVPGQRVVHVMHTPVYDAKHAELLIKNAREPLVIGLLQPVKRGDQSNKDKPRPKMFSRWFGKSNGEKERNVVAKANIDNDASLLLRQGSLRVPQTSSATLSPLIRYGSLRAPAYDPSKSIYAKSEICSTTGGGAIFENNVPAYMPKNTMMFSTPTSPVARFIRQNTDTRSYASSSPASEITATTRPFSMHFTPTSSTIMETKVPNERTSVYSPKNCDYSMSSIMSSNNSIRLPSTSFSYTNNSINSLPGIARHCVSKDGSEFSISSAIERSKRLRTTNDVLRSSQARLIEVPRGDVRLCGGNAIGILAEKSIGGDLLEGDLILEIDGNCVRNTTLECAVNTLWADDDELTRVLIQDGGDRLNRLRLGADGDSFFLRVNIDRSVEHKDELELKAGDVVFVDKTLYLGKKGRWRAWKVDKEGRQREHGAIPSSTTIAQSIRSNRCSNPFPKKAYEWVEKLDTKIRRPVLVFGALVDPFIQLLVDESEKFSQIPRESLNATFEEVSDLLRDLVLIDSQQNEEVYDLYHVISTARVIDYTNQGLHCVLQVDQAAVDRLKKCRIFPIIVKLRFKSVKQLKDINEHICGEKLSSKEAKQIIEKDLKDLDGAVTLVVPNHNNVSFMLTHAVLQLKKIVEEEQRKTVWVQRKIEGES
ncbi:unnamed protein product [Caenorhabditis angaria]|uniref:Guanylate kinase-like domain-containing protein n=1 Tax=Caenorhabditis angaria TaxID=860376 RepID=A0A9P1IMX5_9PELO|nr:unnamed protein product [Caenorhabditis angaria]